ARKAFSENLHFKEVLLAEPPITKYLSEKEIETIMNPYNYIGTAVEQVESVVKRLR
ncbi:MAG: adenylosuccinate lyase, partial [Methanosarcinales archaeon]